MLRRRASTHTHTHTHKHTHTHTHTRTAGVGGRFDRHFHDCDEYWLVFKGKANVYSEGREFYVRKGDIVCTHAGDEHDVLAVYEEFEAFYLEAATPEGGRTGHLHREPELASGHDVPFLPLPEDFPDL